MAADKISQLEPQPPVCHLCADPALRVAYSAWGFDNPEEDYKIMRCSACGVAATSPILSAEALGAYYNPNYYGGAQKKLPSLQKFAPWIEYLVRRGSRRRAAILHGLLMQRRRLADTVQALDVGCGRGVFLRELATYGYQCTGIDITDFTQDRPLPFTFRQGGVEAQNFPAQTFDAISIWHVLEHLQDPAGVVHELARIIKPGGILNIAVPNFDSWQAQFFGANWFHLDLPRHLYHFGVPTLRALLRKEGFTVRRETTLAWDQNVYGLLQSAQNAALPRAQANRLYSLLKHRGQGGAPTPTDLVALGGLAGWAALMMPAAIAESVVSSWVGRGASAIFYLERT